MYRKGKVVSKYVNGGQALSIVLGSERIGFEEPHVDSPVARCHWMNESFIVLHGPSLAVIGSKLVRHIVQC
jgi:hypothetical protein